MMRGGGRTIGLAAVLGLLGGCVRPAEAERERTGEPAGRSEAPAAENRPADYIAPPLPEVAAICGGCECPDPACTCRPLRSGDCSCVTESFESCACTCNGRASMSLEAISGILAGSAGFQPARGMPPSTTTTTTTTCRGGQGE
ncbi:MAG: hypothetical protein QME96_15460 [Myxococcota bacterium]|nr:hypothetical protein [Myxococcota bacterium]